MEYLTYEAKNAEVDFGLSINTVGKTNKNLESFLNWCFSKEITAIFSLKHIVSVTEEVHAVYLIEDELVNLKI